MKRASQAIRRRTLVESIVSEIVRGIFDGEFPVGQNLPPMRTLAQRYDVTIGTAQRATARLEEMGLLEVRHGSGMRVLDPVIHGGFNAMPHWIELALNRPNRACAILADCLELRREILVNQLIRVRALIREMDPTIVEAAAARIRAAADSESLYDVGSADLSLHHALLQVRPQIAYSAVFAALERVVQTTPPLFEALYADPAKTADNLIALHSLACSRMSDTRVRQQAQALLEGTDREAVDRLRTILSRRTSPVRGES